MSEMEQVLIAPKSIREFEPSPWYNYVIQMRREFMTHYKAKKEAARLRSAKPKAKDYSFRVNPKGTPIITIRNRKPKYLTRNEVDELAREHNMPLATMWKIVMSKKISIKDTPQDTPQGASK